MIGDRGERIEIQKPVETVDSEGQPVKTWQSVVKTWAEVMTVGAREFESVKSISSEIEAKFELNYRKEMIECQRTAEVAGVKMRIVWLGDYWNIQGIRRASTKVDMWIYVSRVK